MFPIDKHVTVTSLCRARCASIPQREQCMSCRFPAIHSLRQNPLRLGAQNQRLTAEDRQFRVDYRQIQYLSSICILGSVLFLNPLFLKLKKKTKKNSNITQIENRAKRNFPMRNASYL